MIGASYPLLDTFWTILWVFAFVFWIAVLVSVVFDLFRSSDMSGLAKAVWFLFILVLPLFGVLAYLILRGPGMAARVQRRGREGEAAFRRYIEDVSAKGNIGDQLVTLTELHNRGDLSDEEFTQAKHRLVA